MSKTPKPPLISARRFAFFGLIIPSILVALDQWSKWAAMNVFGKTMNACALVEDPEKKDLSVIPIDVSPIIDLNLLCNRGISWGLLPGDNPIKRWLLTIFAFLMVAGMLYFLRRTQDRWGQVSLSLVIAGALGNAIDRALFGAVTDMIDASDIGFNYVFNVADSYITVGIIALFITSWLTERAEKKAAAEAADTASAD